MSAVEELRLGPVDRAEQIGEKADELWDVYDRDRNRTGRTHRRGDPWPEGSYRLTVHICIVNSAGQLLIQQRQPWKKGWSGMWDVSVGGSAQAGDDSRAAATREVREELGLDLDLRDQRPAFSVSFSQGFDDFWIVHREVDFAELTLQPSEVQAIRWATRQEVLDMVAQGTFIPYPQLDLVFRLAQQADCIDIWKRA